jgi:hypothetical protein
LFKDDFLDFAFLDCWCRPNERADIVFVYEESYSTGELVYPSEWNWQKEMLAKFVEQMYVDPNNGIRIGAVTYNTVPKIRFHLNAYTTASQVADAFLAIPTDRRSWLFENDTDYIYKGLETARDSMFLESKGDRSDVPNYYIYTTDYIFPGDNPYNTGLDIRNAGDNYIWAIGVKSAASQSQLSQSVGSDGKYYTGSSFSALNTVDHAKTFWEMFRECPLVDPADGKYCKSLHVISCV